MLHPCGDPLVVPSVWGMMWRLILADEVSSLKITAVLREIFAREERACDTLCACHFVAIKYGIVVNIVHCLSLRTRARVKCVSSWVVSARVYQWKIMFRVSESAGRDIINALINFNQMNQLYLSLCNLVL